MASLTLDHEINIEYEELASHGVKYTTIDLVGGILCKICRETLSTKKEYDAHYKGHNAASSEIIYTCVVCNKEKTCYPSFRNHCYSAHIIKNRYKCNHCSKFFCKQSVLNQHVQAVHTLKCSYCNERFSVKKDFEIHQLTHKDKFVKPPYNCLTCKKQIVCTDSCENHIDEHCTSQYSCPICDQKIDSTNAIEHISRHFVSVVKEEIFDIQDVGPEENAIEVLGGILCCFCHCLFRNKFEFDSHFTEHGDRDILYTCNICQKHYNIYKTFHNHCYNHFAKDRFECELCDNAFPRLSLLVLHTTAAHSGLPSDKPFPCALCPRTYMSVGRLRQHMEDHHHTRSFLCVREGCSQVFKTAKELINHQKEHNGAPENSCRQCDLPFISPASCVRHLHVHKKKQYSCPICDKKYAEKLLIMKHISQHFESVLHICKICGKSYNARHRFIQHVKTHSTHKAFKCEICGKDFDKPYRLQDHLNVHTGKKPYQCKFCDKTFACSANLSKHITRIHRGRIEEGKTKDVAKKVKDKHEINVVDYSVESDSTMESDNIIIDKDWQIEVKPSPNLHNEWQFIEETNTNIIIEKDWQIEVKPSPNLHNEWQLIEETNTSSVYDNIYMVTDKVIDYLPTDDILDISVSEKAGEMSVPSAVWPREYGPEPQPEEPPLPHMDPRLASLPNADTKHHFAF